ncbi:MAG: hypothetical protein J6K76_00380 [Spirochaetaceae bacterium]|nr:hypothetical protein [Spirochaetaceae bacterium]
MKLMKKVLVLALAAATILMVACDNGNGGGGTSSSGADGNGGGTSTGGDTFVLPTLPESKGNDSFAGLETLTINSYVRYKVDTTKRVLTEEELAVDDTTWSKSAEYSYSYDGTANPLTITTRLEARYKGGKRVTPTEELAADKDAFKTGFTQGFGETFDELSVLDTTTKEAELVKLNEQFGLTLTVADLAADEKNATLEKVWNSKRIQDMLKEQQDTLKKEFSQTPTYAVTLTEQSGTTAKIEVEGQYDSKRTWYDQQAGNFSGNTADSKIDARFFFGGGIIYVVGDGDTDYYTPTEYTTNSITCINDRDGTSKTFSYTTKGTGKDTVVTITVEADKIECTWQPSFTIGQY